MLPLSLAVLAMSQDVRKPSLTGDTVKHPNFESKILGNRRNLIVVLPPGYKVEETKRYPVFYFQDGQNLCDGMTSFIPNKEWRADETLKALVESKLIPPMIIVGIDNAGMDRGNEYLPTSVKQGPNQMGGKADLYGQMLIKEILPFINTTYRTKTGPQNTYLGGSSFGGIITLYLGLTHSEVFGRLAVMSPSVWWDNRDILKRVTKRNLKIWLDMGTAEGTNGLSDARLLRDTFVTKGWRMGKDLAYFEDIGAAHNEEAWARRLPAALMFLLR